MRLRSIEASRRASIIEGPRESPLRGNMNSMTPLSGQTRYSIHHKSLDARKARILIRALIDCAKAGIKPSFSTTQMLRGLSLYLECGTFSNKSWRLYHRVSDAARPIVAAGEKGWKTRVTFEHVRPLSKMYQMFLDERKTLTLDRAAFIIGEYPPILITVEEEHRMAKLGFSVEGHAGTAIRGDQIFRIQSEVGWGALGRAWR